MDLKAYKEAMDQEVKREVKVLMGRKVKLEDQVKIFKKITDD